MMLRLCLAAVSLLSVPVANAAVTDVSLLCAWQWIVATDGSAHAFSGASDTFQLRIDGEDVFGNGSECGSDPMFGRASPTQIQVSCQRSYEGKAYILSYAIDRISGDVGRTLQYVAEPPSRGLWSGNCK